MNSADWTDCVASLIIRNVANVVRGSLKRSGLLPRGFQCKSQEGYLRYDLRPLPGQRQISGSLVEKANIFAVWDNLCAFWSWKHSGREKGTIDKLTAYEVALTGRREPLQKIFVRFTDRLTRTGQDILQTLSVLSDIEAELVDREWMQIWTWLHPFSASKRGDLFLD